MLNKKRNRVMEEKIPPLHSSVYLPVQVDLLHFKLLRQFDKQAVFLESFHVYSNVQLLKSLPDVPHNSKCNVVKGFRNNNKLKEVREKHGLKENKEITNWNVESGEDQLEQEDTQRNGVVESSPLLLYSSSC